MARSKGTALTKLREKAMQRQKEDECIEVTVLATGLKFKIPWYYKADWERVFAMRKMAVEMVDLRLIEASS
ncbi:MAG: hypothetical protein PHT97_10980 [Methanoculleus sp.]|uniref:hypothetical protein n=1 Tax=Methanoculleus sp. TaxID=90427 RepID=UPI00260DF89B|nr:hypothetical protein [Methanoculleus sp.]MDD2255263.1 hypothetical protein [Methanoculleus sp.]MDD4471665.1 hypothetical protein [Methanoculleus sp.]